LTWDPPDDDGGTPVTGYKVYRGTTEGAEILLVTLGDVTTYVDDGVVNGQTYYYKVSAVNTVGEGPFSEVEDATPTAESGDDDEDEGDSTTLYIIIAIIAIAAVAAVAAFFFLKKK
jgi:fibronectin type 3 domain-containing protein